MTAMDVDFGRISRVYDRYRPPLPKTLFERLRAFRLGPDVSGCPVFFLPGNPFTQPPWVQLGLRPAVTPPLGGTIWEEWSAPEGPP